MCVIGMSVKKKKYGIPTILQQKSIDSTAQCKQPNCVSGKRHFCDTNVQLAIKKQKEIEDKGTRRTLRSAALGKRVRCTQVDDLKASNSL